MKKILSLLGAVSIIATPALTTACGTFTSVGEQFPGKNISQINFKMYVNETKEEILENLDKALSDFGRRLSIRSVDVYMVRNEVMIDFNDDYIAEYDDKILVAAKRSADPYGGYFTTWARAKGTDLGMSNFSYILDGKRMFFTNTYKTLKEEVIKEIERYSDGPDPKVDVYAETKQGFVLIDDTNLTTQIGAGNRIKMVAQKGAEMFSGSKILENEFRKYNLKPFVIEMANMTGQNDKELFVDRFEYGLQNLLESYYFQVSSTIENEDWKVKEVIRTHKDGSTEILAWDDNLNALQTGDQVVVKTMGNIFEEAEVAIKMVRY
ncbi:hypothetical protein SCHIN_v1c11550 [Spiroplasma chinense]|uniref:Lipoprotein n=1 Tax=Spiroplasma chinense TaxID=216932 RepID=A0A5B9Y5A5_9MOLU|nr:lipoprotein [Spiroplasma chinense]QEH62348.1 hypothetical protein SCHIN_v1c11550 [Spiroplasma chinense]